MIRDERERLDMGDTFQRVTGNRLLSHWSGLLDTGAQQLTRLLRRDSRLLRGVTITQMVTFDQWGDALWQRVCRDYPVMVVRDQPYLNWRFACRPDARYTLLVATRGPDLVGYLVLRSTERARVRWGYLVDFLVEGSSSSLFALLVEEAVECLRRERVAIISCLASYADIQDDRVFRLPKSYPVYDSDYRDSLAVIREFVGGLENFHTIGRNGLHRYNNQDHSMLTGMLAVRNLLGEEHDLWSVNTERSYYEEFTTK